MTIVLLLTLDHAPAQQSMNTNQDSLMNQDCLSSNKENMSPIESVTPPSLRNLSLEEEANEPENEATLWEANVARNLETMPQSKLPLPKKDKYSRRFRTRH